MATAKWEHLACEYEPKPHKWKRPLGMRGRKPRFCEKHRPTVSVSTGTKAEAKTLHCQIGNHDWIREPKRGRVPVNCPEHQPVKPASNSTVTTNPNGMVILHCEIGKHNWEREPKRGRKPTSCPVHSAAPVAPRSVPVNVVPGSETGDPAPKRKPGRPRIHESDEEREAAAIARSHERVDNLEGALKERGTHISQQTPYILYKKVAEKPSRRKGVPPTTTWEKVTEHSPLMQAQYVNTHAKAFDDGEYRYERNGKVVAL